MLIADLDRIDGGQDPQAWPHSILAPRRKALSTRHGLRNRRQTLLDAYQALDPHRRAEVRSAMARQDEIPAVFGDGLSCPRLDQLHPTVRKPIKDLFEFAFNILLDLGLRDQNYKLLYDRLRYKVCAFCGIELLDAPRQKREALDHYLPIAIYPFAGANFRNLSPMGTKCNSRYKGKQDIICDDATGQRRLCCDPYQSPELLLSLNESKPFEGAKIGQVICPEWHIQWIGGDPAKVQTWETVFDIEERYRESSLNPNFRDWIDHFGQWAARKAEPLSTVASVRDALLEFSEIVVPEGLADSAFLKRAAVKMLAYRCDESDGGARLAEWLRGYIEELRLLPSMATQGRNLAVQ